MEKNKKRTATLPLIAMRGVVLYPNTTMHFDVGRDKSILALKTAVESDHQVFLVTQNDITKESLEQQDLYKIGVVATIKQLLKSDKNTVRVLVEGNYKAKLIKITETNPHFIAECEEIKPLNRPKISEDEQVATVRLVKNLYDQYASLLPNVPRELILRVLSEDDPHRLLAEIGFNSLLGYEEKQEILSIPNVYTALNQLAIILQREIEVMGIEQKIYTKVRQQMDGNQRDYFLREQLKAIQQELGSDGEEDEADDYMYRISSIHNIDDDSREKLYKECRRLAAMSSQSQEANVIRTYLDNCLDLPFDKKTKETVNLSKAAAQLDSDHYGLTKVKERILESLAVKVLAPEQKGQIICLVGPPGVGKTSIASSVAKTLNRKYARVSLGGVKDESDIRGHRKTYVGSMPGRIITTLIKAGTRNPLILLDEIDKMGNDYRGDPASAMLEVLDSAQNNAFVDHYIEIPFDLSEVMFLTTANSLKNIPTPLLDRMEIIELGSYTREEKFHIAKRHLVKKQLKKHGLSAKTLTIKDDAIYDIIDSYTREAGVRTLERTIGAICRKAAKLIVDGTEQKVTVTSKNLEEIYIPRKYHKQNNQKENRVGIVDGLAWTSVGGEMLEIEAAIMSGTGKVKLTGSLGDVMKESAEIAISYVRSIADKYGIDKNFYKNCDIHIHAPEGAVPKDGPSAGVTMITCLISALSGIPVRGDVCMTGEISLTGRVMPIGGLKEKAMAAHREHKKVVIIPLENKPDLHEIDKVVRDELTFVPVSNVNDVLDIALIKGNDFKSQWLASEFQAKPQEKPVGSEVIYEL